MTLCVFIETLLKEPLNEQYTHEGRVNFHLFWISMQTSMNSFSKTIKRILVIFGAKWSWGLACLVSVLCLLLLFSGKRQTLQEKIRTLFLRLFFRHPCRHGQLLVFEVGYGAPTRNIDNYTHIRISSRREIGKHYLKITQFNSYQNPSRNKIVPWILKIRSRNLGITSLTVENRARS